MIPGASPANNKPLMMRGFFAIPLVPDYFINTIFLVAVKFPAVAR